MNIPKGIGHIGKEEYQNELQALVSGVIMTCDDCGKEYALEGGMKALIDSFDDMPEKYLCPNCK